MDLASDKLPAGEFDFVHTRLARRRLAPEGPRAEAAAAVVRRVRSG